ncbi:P-loop ATPase [Nocardia yunnanensis]|uniref:P-loop ATPase n=1 Tax=Nocardia yunnanensis TaxID=2382165 RepID=A0A386ZMF1_9NOCA|nr:P-loop NTPase fold protein [Nocardia yunnanensis]AYF77859.1 P-loop ATPase [Nocardia yunnanensis]
MTGGVDLWDDNPTTVDLLGLATVVDAVVGALHAPGLDPVTVGLHGPWGAGKSSALHLLRQKLSGTPGYLVIHLDPWEFDDQFDVRGTVVAEVLQEIVATYAYSHDGVQKLWTRIRDSRVAAAVARGVIFSDTDKLIERLTPAASKDSHGMAGFRDEFTTLLDDLADLRRIVVLIDDLDRCLPDAVTATLEAIKLFLSVPKMSFVLAADKEMVRSSIAASLDASGRGDLFAERYLEKIVQVPFSLPQMSSADAETYIALLLCAQQCSDTGHYDSLVAHAQRRRSQGQAPPLADLDRLPYKPDAGIFALANRFATGLSAQSASSPRSIKRFLNQFRLRQQIAAGQGIRLEPSVIAKLMLLEDSLYGDFQVLVKLADEGRSSLLAAWQDWATGNADERPEGVSEESRAWAAAAPDIRNEPIGNYLSLAASLGGLTASATLSQEQLDWVAALMGESEVHRRRAQELVSGRPSGEQRAMVRVILSRARGNGKPEYLVESLVYLAAKTSELVHDIAEGLWSIRDVMDPTSGYEIAMSTTDEIRLLAQRLAGDTELDPMVRRAIESAASG